ncbi:MAG: hypothetical protein ACRDPZ_09875 [Gaiellaceae bacterium]
MRRIRGNSWELDDDPAPIEGDRVRRYLGEESSDAYDLQRTFGFAEPGEHPLERLPWR